MALKRLTLVALLGVFLFGLVGTAFAQTPHFVPSSTPFQQRQTGVTETAGDIVLTCSVAGTIAANTGLSVSMIPFAAAITNDPMVNGNNTLYIPFDGAPGPIPGTVIINVGVLPNMLTISFQTALVVAVNDQIRIRAIRVNDQAAGLQFPQQIQAQLTVSPAGAIQFDQTNIVAVSVPTQTISVIPGPSATLLQCLVQQTTRTVTVTELSPQVFTSQAQENGLSSTPPPTNPTRLQFTLAGVPGGLTVDVPVSVALLGGGGTGVLDFNLAISTPPDGGVGTRYTSPATRDISLIYDVNGAPDPSAIESAVFNFTFTTTGVVATQLLGCATIQARLAPLSTTPARARFIDPISAPRRIVPRFIDPFQPSMPQSIVCVVTCACHLKFPYVTNTDGLDTTLIVTNGTADPYGTAGQSGTVDLYFYGENAPVPPRVTLPTVPPGGIVRRNLSDLAPNFQGYVIAISNFQFCHGTAFLVDSGLGSITDGYTALLIPDPVQLGGRQPGFSLQGSVSGNVVGGVLTGTVTIRDAFGERLVH